MDVVDGLRDVELFPGTCRPPFAALCCEFHRASFRSGLCSSLGLAPSAGWHFRRLAHFSHSAVDQNVTVAFEGNAQGRLAEINESTLKSLGEPRRDRWVCAEPKCDPSVLEPKFVE